MSTPDDKLCFFSGSADKPPGKGSNEAVADPAAYEALSQRPHWRRTLSNFHRCCPFEFDGRTYATVEHAFQAAKIRLADPAAAEQFTVESGSELGRLGDGLAARRQRMMVRLTPAQLAAWGAMSDTIMHRAQAAKFAQCPEAAAVLRDTGRAQLWHVAPRAGAVRFEGLEAARGHEFSCHHGAIV